MQKSTLNIIRLLVLCMVMVHGTRSFAQQLPANDSVRPAVTPKDSGLVATGVISDAATGKPLSAINVAIPDFSAALTDDNGRFSIKVRNYQTTLFVSAEGFQSKEIPLKGRRHVAAALYEETFSSIYDYAVLPFGAKPRNQAVQAVTSINTEGNWNRSTETPDSYLQGKVAGLQAIYRSGTPNAGAYLALRGFNSLFGTSQPLVIVDGMVYDITDYGTSLIANHYSNALADIDPRDIENITVIKDGTSTYGTKGANGVILITTTHAASLATKIDFGVYGGVNVVPQKMPVMNASDYRVYLSDVLKTRGWTDDQIQAQPYMNDDPANPDYYRYHNSTDWQRQVFKNSSSSNVYLKVTGGDDIARYALSLGYLKNAGVTQQTGMTRYNVRFNADLNLSKGLTATTNLAYTYYEQDLKDQGLAYKTNPIFLALIKAPFLNKNEQSDKGAVSPNLADTDTLGVSNPSAAIQNMIGSSRNYRFFGSISFKLKLSDYISLGSLIGITVDQVREQLFIPRKGISNDTLSNAVADSRLGGQTKRLFTVYNDTYGEYARLFNSIHRLNLRAGVRFISSSSEQDYALGYNSATDEFISVGTGVNALRRAGGNIGKYSWINTYAAADYGFKDKYFLSFNMAADLSSRFGTAVKNAPDVNGYSVALMPSVGASWLISSENFMSAATFVNVLKLRATYSRTGNDDTGNYTAKQSYVSQNLLGLQGLVRGNISNPALQWETTNKANVGLDAALFNERLNVSVDVFQHATSNMLTYEPVQAASGYAFAITNSGSMKTKGVDISVSGRLVNTRSVKWDMGLTIGMYKNHITQLPGNSFITSFGGATILTQTGLPANLFYGLKTNGVYASDAEAAAAHLYKKQPDGSIIPFKGGDVRFINTNNDSLIDNTDRQVIGNPNPDYFGAFSNKVSWKRLSLEAVFTFTKGNNVYNGVRAALESVSTTNNQLQSVVNRWRSDGQVTTIPKATWGDPMGNSSFSDRWIEDGSFLRLKVVTLLYNIPVKGAGFIKNASVYVTGNNLLTFTKYLGYDPEFQAAENIFARGVDVALEPQFKSVVAGLRIGL